MALLFLSQSLPNLTKPICTIWIHLEYEPGADGVGIIAVSLLPEVPGSISEHGKKGRLFCGAFFGVQIPFGDNLTLASHPRMDQKDVFWNILALVS